MEEEKNDISAPVRLSVKFDHSFSSSWTHNSGENIVLHPKHIIIVLFVQD